MRLTKKLRQVYRQLWNIERNTLGWLSFSIRHPEEKKELNKNKRFYNIHQGHRCFILGNGPSLKDIDLSLLANEYTFTVNQISRNPHFKELKTNYHFYTDADFFEIDENNPEDMEFLDAIKKLNTEDNQPTVFFNISGMSFAKKYGLDKHLDLHYIYGRLNFLENFKRIDYSKFVPGFSTVVQFCITMAIYMGFSEIYLLGCDNTGIITVIQTMLDNQVDNYAYEVSANEQKRMKKVASKHNLYDYACGYSYILKDYILLYSYCQKRGIKLLNCTEQSAIDAIPKVRLSDVLKNNK